jgi:hypothetical protein
VRHVGLQSKPSQVGNVKEGHLIDVNHEFAVLCVSTKRALR